MGYRLLPPALALAAALAGASSDARPTAAQPPNRAGLVVQLGDGSVRTFCIAFPESSITGDELLRRSGLEVRADVSALGTTVCRIDDTGCDYPREACWCRCRTLGAGCTYWGYNTLEGDRWNFSVLGAAARAVHDGDVDGWAWGQGAIVAGAAPPVMTFDDLCASPAATTSINLPTLDPTQHPPVEPRRRPALPSPTESARIAAQPSTTSLADASPNDDLPAAFQRPTVPPTDFIPTDLAPADLPPPDAAPEDRAARDPASRDPAPTDDQPAHRPIRDIAPTTPVGTPQPPAAPHRADGRAADRIALAVYVGLVVTLAAAGWWLRRAR